MPVSLSKSRLLVQVNTVCIHYMIWDEVCNSASGNIIRMKAIQITGTIKKGHKSEICIVGKNW